MKRYWLILFFIFIHLQASAIEPKPAPQTHRCKYYLSNPLVSPFARFYFKMKAFYLTHVYTYPPIGMRRAWELYEKATKVVEIDSAQRKLYDQALRRQTEIVITMNSKYGGGSVSQEITPQTPPDLIRGIIAYRLSEFILEGRAIEWDYLRNTILQEQYSYLKAEEKYIRYVADLNEAKLNRLSYENYRELRRVDHVHEQAEARQKERMDMAEDLKRADKKTKALEIQFSTRFEDWRDHMLNLPLTHRDYETLEDQTIAVLRQESKDNRVLGKIFHIP